MKLIITIDTEEDGWATYTRTSDGAENILEIPALQKLLLDFNATPTYLITYAIAVNDRAKTILKEILKAGYCEIGAHCHPWNTPPFEEDCTRRNSMLSNLPPDLQYKKLTCLHASIRSNFDIEPVSFRSGRWGYSHHVARHLQSLGYKVDSSITPHTDWTEYHGPDFSRTWASPYKCSVDNIFESASIGGLLEVPATIGFVPNAMILNTAIIKMLKDETPRTAQCARVLAKVRLARKVWLSPEVSSAAAMIALTETMRAQGHKVINMFFHSSSLKQGLNPFARTKRETRRIYERIETFLRFARAAGIETIKLSDACEIEC